MAQSQRVLFVPSALAPFTPEPSSTSLSCSLSGNIQEAGDFETRIMMPCYGCIDERKHNLHEVIRLSGTDVPMGTGTEAVTVKVASAPDAQLQVYFMDHEGYFDRDDRTTDGTAHDDARRALFFNRSVLETLHKLRWAPDLIHSFGWMGGLVPQLLSTSYANDDLLGSTKTVFTPEAQDPELRLNSSFSEKMGLALDGNTGSTLPEIGLDSADATLFPPDGTPIDGASKLSEEANARTEQLVTLYNQMLGEVPA